MTKDNQIKEMTITMLEASTSANVEPVLEIGGKEFVLDKKATKFFNNILEQAFIPFLAETLYNAEYRKSSDVAKEISDEIAKHLMQVREIPNYVAIEVHTLIDIFKKYKRDEK